MVMIGFGGIWLKRFRNKGQKRMKNKGVLVNGQLLLSEILITSLALYLNYQMENYGCKFHWKFEGGSIHNSMM